MVNLDGALDQADLQPDLTVGTAGGAEELDGPEPNGPVAQVNQEISEFESERADQGFRRLRRLGVEDFER